MNDTPRTLDWVKERAACSLAQVFKELQLGVEEDVRAINDVRALDDDHKFQTSPINHTGFVVYRNVSAKNVRFFLQPDHIEIDNDVSGEKHTATITLNNEGRCKPVLNGEELELWQLRRTALEPLFFS
jgi:hypothetical protein